MRRLLPKAAEWAAAAAEVARAHPGRAPAILLGLAHAHRAHGLGPRDFFTFDLHNRPRSTWGDYVKYRPTQLRLMLWLNMQRDRAVARDKVRASARARDAGVAIAPILAVAGRGGDAHGFPAFDDVGALAAFLARADLPDALFLKPAAEGGGAGLRLAAREGAGWRLDGRALDHAGLAAALLTDPPPGGTLIQPRLANHPAIQAVFGPGGLSTARVCVALTRDGPELFTSTHRIVVGTKLADNFSQGSAGNMFAALDTQGRVREVFWRPPGSRFLMARRHEHPDTGARMTGFSVPLWRETADLARRAAAAFPEAPLLALDIAVTAGGPVLVEANTSWNTVLPQLADGPLGPVYAALLPRLAIGPRARDVALNILAGGDPPPDTIGFRR